MKPLLEEILTFRRRKMAEGREAQSRAALRLSCGIDLPELGHTPRSALSDMLSRVMRAIQRERLKGLQKHWSYDLNRHIALKQARDDIRLALGMSAQRDGEPQDDSAENTSGARRRRQKLI